LLIGVEVREVLEGKESSRQLNTGTVFHFIRRVFLKVVSALLTHSNGLRRGFGQVNLQFRGLVVMLILLKLFENANKIISHELIIAHMFFLDVTDAEWGVKYRLIPATRSL
jgi:hypothetical protein